MSCATLASSRSRSRVLASTLPALWQWLALLASPYLLTLATGASVKRSGTSFSGPTTELRRRPTSSTGVFMLLHAINALANAYLSYYSTGSMVLNYVGGTVSAIQSQCPKLCSIPVLAV